MNLWEVLSIILKLILGVDEKIVDPDQWLHQKPADLNPHSFQKKV